MKIRALWKEARKSNIFPSRRLYMEFFRDLQGKAYVASGGPRVGMALLGRWRDGGDFHCLWFIRALERVFPELLRFSLREYLAPGEQLITRMLEREEASAFEEEGFLPFQEIVVLEGDFSTLRPPRRSPDMSVRRFRPGDLGELLDMDLAAFEPLWCLDRWSFRCISRYCRHNRIVIAEREGRAIGYCMAGTDGYRGFIQRLGVHPEHQGRGWGSVLLGEQLSWMRSLGTRIFIVNTQRNNRQALRLYRSSGFVREAGSRYIYRYVCQ